MLSDTWKILMQRREEIFQIIDLIIICFLDIIQFNVEYTGDIPSPKRESVHTEVPPVDSGVILTYKNVSCLCSIISRSPYQRGHAWMH